MDKHLICMWCGKKSKKHHYIPKYDKKCCHQCYVNLQEKSVLKVLYKIIHYFNSSNVCPLGFLITIPLCIGIIVNFNYMTESQVNLWWSLIHIPMVYILMDFKLTRR